MNNVLFATNSERLAPYTAFFVGALIATYFTFEAPLSGMSTNPARSFGSAVHANYWHALWINFIAPWACWPLESYFFECAAAPLPTAPNFTTPTANAASFITLNT
jgi:aquaporin Z